MYYKKNVDYVELLWEDFTYQIDNIGHKKQENMYYPRFTKVIIHYFLFKDKTISRRNKIGMHTSRDDYLINTLRFVFANEESQIYGAQLPKSMTSPEMREFSPEEPRRKSKRVKRPAKKSTNLPTAGVVIRVASTEEAQYEEVCKKSLRDFHKTHPSGSGTVIKIDLSAAKIKPSVTNEGFGAKPGVLDVTKEESSKRSDSEHETNENETSFESDQEENVEDVEDVKDDEEEKVDEFVKTPSNSTDDEDETNVEDKVEGDEDKGMDYTTNKFDDDVDITLNQVIKDAHVTISTVVKKIEVPVTSSSHSSDLAFKFLKFSDIPHTDAEIVSPMDVHVYQEVPMIKSMVTESLEHGFLAKESSQPQSIYKAADLLIEFELKKILIDKMDGSQSYLTASEYRECYDGLIKSYNLNKSLFSTNEKVYSLKRSQKDKDKDDDPFVGSDRGLKKRKTSKDDEPIKGTKSQSKSSGKSIYAEESKFEVADSKMPQDQEENLGDDDEELKRKVVSKRPAFKLLKGIRTNFSEFEYDFEECYKALSEKLDWENPEGGDYPFDLTKPLPLVMNENRQIVPTDYFFNNHLKYLQGGISTMTYTTSITKTKFAEYDLPGIEDMVPNIWSLVKVTYDKHEIWVTWVELCECSPEAWLFKRESKILNWESKVTRRRSTSPSEKLPNLTSRKRDPYTPYPDPQGFIYVEKMEFIGKKRAHIMIKAIDKQLKDRRMMRSFKKFVGGRHYETDLWLLR
uniref:Uncharacterized protein n=1 Tax=Tanacetum cinerariifolium TaxID=118510 RepID=A0A6L2NSD9_TANCI|nr:hypothetical protein [Tanacetum cinerariifolium]